MSSSYSINRGSVHNESGQLAVDDQIWADPGWDAAAVASIEHFHPSSSDHHPATAVRLIYDEAALYLRFDVTDQFVLARAAAHQQMVCLDSCVEFFVRPRRDAGYFNFEFNCGGTAHVSYIENPIRTTEGFAKFEMWKIAEIETLSIAHTLPRLIDTEIVTPLTWRLSCRIPFALLTSYSETPAPRSGDRWDGNFYKCADRSSHPHWATWAPIGERLNFHDPRKFVPLIFT